MVDQGQSQCGGVPAVDVVVGEDAAEVAECFHCAGLVGGRWTVDSEGGGRT